MPAEILAPAGSMEALAAAVRCGADAVYLGGEAFSARQNAANFSGEELIKAVEYCHLHGVKVHQAVNTLVFDSQLQAVKDCILKAGEAGVSALIVQDLGVARMARELLPNMPLHASTQMSLHSPEGVKFAKEMGFERAVLSRELSREQIKKLCNLGIETEVFVHGALCMAVSGQCYLSAMIGSRSANRGLCAQACRLPFSAVDGKPRCDLSLKDLSLTANLRELSDIGVTSLKIEGRMKRPEYVAAAVTACRAALDGKEPDIETLRAVFSRSGFTDGYYQNRLGRDMFGVREKEDVTSATGVFPKLQELYKKEKKSADIRFVVDISEEKPSELTASDGVNSVTVTGEIPQKAISRPSDLEQAEKQLSKLGDTIYNFAGVTGNIGKGLMLPASCWNDLRRKAAAALDEERIRKNRRYYEKGGDAGTVFPKLLNIKFQAMRIQARTAEQLDGADLSSVELVILPIEECEKGVSFTEKTAVLLPRFIPDGEDEIKERLKVLKGKGFSHLSCQNLSHLRIGKELGFILHGNFGLNITNSLSLLELAQAGMKDATVSFEMKTTQIAGLGDFMPYGIVGYGRLPLMLMRNCPVKSAVGCKRKDCRLTDRTGRSFPLQCDGVSAELLNSEVLYLADRQDEFRDVSFITFMLTTESKGEAAYILRRYQNREAPSKKDYTRGLYYRGIQ